jgi:TonB family protein
MRSLPISGLVLVFSAALHAQTAADSPPSLIYRSEPEYSAEATRARVQSTVMLSITVGEDGKAHDIRVAQGAGFGLDEMAIEAMDKWRFNPATHEGHPAAVPANIEMNFGILAKNDTEDRSGQRVRLNFTLAPDVSRPELIVGKLPANPKSFGEQSVSIHLQVDAQGVPKNVTVISSDDPVWQKQVLRVVQTWRFRPAATTATGNPVPAEAVFELVHSGPPEPPANVVLPDTVTVSNGEGPRPAGLGLVPAPLPVAGTVARLNHTATRLANGTVLLAGGSADTPTPHQVSTAQTFDWATRTIANTGALLTPRQSHTATLLTDGAVLIIGGVTAAGHPLGSAEIFDPSTGKFSSTGNLHTARQSHAAALLPDGRVLVCGGIGLDGKPLATAEIYDSRIKEFVPAGEMTRPRNDFSAVPLRDGRILLVGGDGVSAEIFNPESGAFSDTGNMNTARIGFGAALLKNGQVLIAGGRAPRGSAIATAELFDPATNSFHATGEMAWTGDRTSALLLKGGSVLVSGSSPQTEIYDPASGTFNAGPLLTGAHGGDTATLLEDGSVLLAGSGVELLQVR